MPDRVDFYLLDTADEASKLLSVCKVASKAYQQGLKVYIRTSNPHQSEQLDQLLWSFHPASFVPHAILGYEPSLLSNSTSVVISDQPATPTFNQLLISLTGEVPEEMHQFHRIADFIADDEQQKIMGRARFKQYRQQGIEPNAHKIHL